jgi:hypothetical protein
LRIAPQWTTLATNSAKATRQITRGPAHVPWRLIWSATMRNAASSLTVNCVAWCGGTGQHAARRRRRSIERLPPRRRRERAAAVDPGTVQRISRPRPFAEGTASGACYRIWKARGRIRDPSPDTTAVRPAPRHHIRSAVKAVVIMPRKDGASRRLASEIVLAKHIKKETPKKVPEETQERPASLAGSLFALLGESQPDGTSRWCLVPEYLQLDENAIWDRPILKAFKAFDLDPCYLSEWRQLLGHLAYVLFPYRPGAPRKWTDEQLCLLLADVAAYKRKNPKASDTAICIWLKKNWPKHDPGRLRRVLQDARNPARNDLLWRTAYGLLTQQMLREAAAACGVTEDVSWTEAVEKNVLSKAMQAAVRKAIEEADKLWGH